MLTSSQYLAILTLVASVSAIDVTLTPFKRELTSRAKHGGALPKAQVSIPLNKKVPRSATRKRSPAQVVSLDGYGDDEGYTVPVTIGGQQFDLIVDSGSSDTWVPIKGFQCFSSTGEAQPESACSPGTAGFDPSLSSTYNALPDKNFNVTYGGGFVIGTVAEETVTVGGTTVMKQVIGVGTHVNFVGDGVASGILGLGLPDLTSIYNTTNPDNDSVVTNKDIVTPFFLTALAEGVVTEPYFSMSLNRGSFAAQLNSTSDLDLGRLAFGGIVDVPVTDTSVTVPIQGFVATGTDKTKDFWYAVDVESYNFPGAPVITGPGLTPIIDSGTTLAYLPAEIAQAYNEGMDPPATNSEEFGGWVTACNAAVPPLSVTIGGTAFSIDRKDVLLPLGVIVNGTDLCLCGVQPGGFPVPVPVDNQTIYVLGDVFLHNVVVTYNVEAPSLTITQREAY